MSTVDETPINPSLPERRNSIEKHLQTRPDMKDLKDRHILLDTNVAPYVLVDSTVRMGSWLLTDVCRALQAASQDLDRQRAQNSLKKNLEKRPNRDELVERMFFALGFCLMRELL